MTWLPSNIMNSHCRLLRLSRQETVETNSVLVELLFANWNRTDALLLVDY